MVKYILTDNTMEYDGRTLSQIMAIRSFGTVKAGDLGGFIEHDQNLSHAHDCWLGEGCIARGNTRITDQALLSGNVIAVDSEISGCAKLNGTIKTIGSTITGSPVLEGSIFMFGGEVRDFAEVHGQCDITDSAIVCGHAKIYNTSVREDAVVEGNVTITRSDLKGYAYASGDAAISGTYMDGNAKVLGNAEIYGDPYSNDRKEDCVHIYGNARVYDNAVIRGAVRVYGNAEVCGNADITENVRICGNALVEKSEDVIPLNLGKKSAAFRTQYGDIQVISGKLYTQDGFNAHIRGLDDDDPAKVPATMAIGSITNHFKTSLELKESDLDFARAEPSRGMAQM